MTGPGAEACGQVSPLPELDEENPGMLQRKFIHGFHQAGLINDSGNVLPGSGSIPWNQVRDEIMK
jgi:hypothetical protein